MSQGQTNDLLKNRCKLQMTCRFGLIGKIYNVQQKIHPKMSDFGHENSVLAQKFLAKRVERLFIFTFMWKHNYLCGNLPPPPQSNPMVTL